MRRIATVVALLVVALLALVVGIRSKGANAPTIPGEKDRVIVEVLNGSRIDGLARETTGRLRRAGLDVVYFGDAEESPIDSTLILIRRGDSTGALRVRRTLGLGRITAAPDPRLLLDITVVLGRDMGPALGLQP